MLKEVEVFKQSLGEYFEIDDYQAVDILLATAVSHKVPATEMLWLRIIGASGTGKTELLRTLISQDSYCITMESITAGSIRRGHRTKRDEPTLLERISGKLVITKEFASMLTKNPDAQKEVFGLLRSVHDGEIDSDYGSEQGYLHQVSRFDWIVGTTQYIDRQRQLETQLGSRFIDIRWGSPINRDKAVNMAIENDAGLTAIRSKLAGQMTDIIEKAEPVEYPFLPWLAGLANMAAIFRTPVVRDSKTTELIDIPEVELGTRLGQAMARITKGLLMLGVSIEDLRSYLIRMTLDCMSPVRAGVLKNWLRGNVRQQVIAEDLRISVGAVNRIIAEINILGWSDYMLELIKE